MKSSPWPGERYSWKSVTIRRSNHGIYSRDEMSATMYKNASVISITYTAVKWIGIYKGRYQEFWNGITILYYDTVQRRTDCWEVRAVVGVCIHHGTIHEILKHLIPPLSWKPTVKLLVSNVRQSNKYGVAFGTSRLTLKIKCDLQLLGLLENDV